MGNRGFSAWAFYLVPALAMGYLFWNKKCASLRISDLSAGILGGDSLWKRAARFLLDGAIVFGYFAAMMTTVGIGTPVMGELASHLLGRHARDGRACEPPARDSEHL